MLALGLAACSDSGAKPDPGPDPGPRSPETSSTSPTSDGPRELTFAAEAPEAEVDALQQVVDSFNSSSQTRKVTLEPWTADDLARAQESENLPDIFLAQRRDLLQLSGKTRPVSLLLDERGVDFGDRYSRDALQAFSYDDDLQCMPYASSPMVMYYNSDLVNWQRMQRRGIDSPPIPEDETAPMKWDLAQFAATAEFVSRRNGVDAVWVDPTLRGLAPFVYSGGGELFNDNNEPTSLAFADDGNRETLEQVLAILRDPTLTPTHQELEGSTPLQLFKRGKLAMLPGFRDLVPELRETDGLTFDVIAMPTVEDSATIGNNEGLCISADTEFANDAADFLAYAVSDQALETVARTGYIVPANTEVAGSDAFLSPWREPEHARVFTSALRGMQLPPLLADPEALDRAVDPLLEQMVTGSGVLDLEAITQEIDDASRALLDPEYESQTPTPTESPSD